MEGTPETEEQGQQLSALDKWAIEEQARRDAEDGVDVAVQDDVPITGLPNNGLSF